MGQRDSQGERATSLRVRPYPVVEILLGLFRESAAVESRHRVCAMADMRASSVSWSSPRDITEYAYLVHDILVVV
jgi:hypothetical protein